MVMGKKYQKSEIDCLEEDWKINERLRIYLDFVYKGHSPVDKWFISLKI